MKSPRPVVAFDVYGTLVDTGGMARHLQDSFGERAYDAARLWRDKQIEYSFRRALMRKYVDFDECTAQALTFVGMHMGLTLTARGKQRLLQQYRRLPAYADVPSVLYSLKDAGHACAVLTNGVRKSVRALLGHAGLLQCFDTLTSADEVRTFKPSPAIYERLVKRVDRPRAGIWLVSANAWDVIGAKSCGLKAAWLRRDPALAFDPWGFTPDAVVPDLHALLDILMPGIAGRAASFTR